MLLVASLSFTDATVDVLFVQKAEKLWLSSYLINSSLRFD